MCVFTVNILLIMTYDWTLSEPSDHPTSALFGVFRILKSHVAVCVNKEAKAKYTKQKNKNYILIIIISLLQMLQLVMRNALILQYLLTVILLLYW